MLRMYSATYPGTLTTMLMLAGSSTHRLAKVSRCHLEYLTSKAK